MGEGRDSHQEGGEPADGGTVPAASAASSLLTGPAQGLASGFVSNPFILCHVQGVSSPRVEGVEGSRLDLRPAQTDAGPRQPRSHQPRHHHRHREGTEDVALSRGAGCETNQQKQMGFIWGDLVLLTKTNVLCKLFCISTVFSFCMQANFIHWKTTTTEYISLHGY